MERVETDDPAVRLDIDTHQDYESLEKMIDAQNMGR
jgi:CTP:molybdopterin cytidylyltransferase MocA